jgi:hypothetical protein
MAQAATRPKQSLKVIAGERQPGEFGGLKPMCRPSGAVDMIGSHLHMIISYQLVLTCINWTVKFALAGVSGKPTADRELMEQRASKSVSKNVLLIGRRPTRD